MTPQEFFAKTRSEITALTRSAIHEIQQREGYLKLQQLEQDTATAPSEQAAAAIAQPKQMTIIEWPTLKQVAAVGDYGDWYFLTAARAYLDVLAILEGHAKNISSFMLNGIMNTDKDWQAIRQNMAKIDASRCIPLTFHPLFTPLAQSTGRYYMRPHDYCVKLAKLINFSIQCFFDQVKLPGFLSKVVNKFGSGLRKSQAALTNRLMRHEFNEKNSVHTDWLDTQLTAIQSECKLIFESWDEFLMQGKKPDTELFKSEATELLRFLIQKMRALPMDRPAQVALYIRDETATEMLRLNTKSGAYQHYLSEMQRFLDIKYPQLNDQPQNIALAINRFETEVDALNQLLLKEILNYIGSKIDHIERKNKQVKNDPEICTLLQQANQLCQEKVDDINRMEQGALEGVTQWLDAFTTQLDTLVSLLKKFRQFNADGIHFLMSEATKTCHLMAKDAYFQLRPYTILLQSTMDSYEFVQLETLTFIAAQVKTCCEEFITIFSDNQGATFEGSKWMREFLAQAAFSLSEFRLPIQQASKKIAASS